MRKVKNIVLTRAEGPPALCITVNAPTFAHADTHLKAWALTAPRTGGYDKCDFKVEYEDGDDPYEGRFDLTYDHRLESQLLQRHIADFLDYYFDLGLRRERAAA